MVKRHLKSIAAPPSWHVRRKETKYLMRPSPGAHPIGQSMPLGIVLRSMIPIAQKTKEIKYILHKHEVQVDGKRRTDIKFATGLFDVIALPDGIHFRMLLNIKGELAVTPVAASEATSKISKVVRKAKVAGGRLQLGLSDGRTIITNDKADTQIRVGDCLLIDIPKTTIRKHLPLREGMLVYLQSGKHVGTVGKVSGLHDNQIRFTSLDGKKQHETSKAYAIVVGENTPEITVAIEPATTQQHSPSSSKKDEKEKGQSHKERKTAKKQPGKEAAATTEEEA